MASDVFAPIVRPRLIECIRSRSSRPLLLLIAPAGYGKSVALRQYLATLQGQTVRFELDAEQAALLGFLRGLARALSAVAPHALATLPGAYERASSPRATELARWMSAHLETFRGTIAIDDLHVADGDPEVAAFLTALIERTKGSIKWVLASRSTAGLPVGTWLAYHDADMPVAERDLRFSIDEIRTTARKLGASIGDDELVALLALTDGWPAAMSFALRTSTRSTDLRNVCAVTREMTYRFLAEQVYAALDDVERDLLELAITLPAIDISVLEKAGFDRALPIVERLRERTAFIVVESAGIYRCHDLFRDFLRHQSVLSGRHRYQLVHKRAARALEQSGDMEHAIGAYAAAESRVDVLRVLEAIGFDLLERAQGDIVAKAIESLDETTKRENATILALRGALQAIGGKFARAETLLRHSLSRAGDNRNLVAVVSLRLARLIGNSGKEVSALLEPVAADPAQTTAYRAEALSLIGAQKAIAGDKIVAADIDVIESMLNAVESDVSRAKVLHHLGIISRHAGRVERAFTLLAQSSDLAIELQLYSLGSRVNAVLSNLALHEEDDVARQFSYATIAADAATKAGDAYAVETALLQMLSAEMRRGNVDESIAIEERLVDIHSGDLARCYVALFQALRLGWDGEFEKACYLLQRCWHDIHFEFDRLQCGAELALFLALTERREESVNVIQHVTRLAEPLNPSGLFRVRAMAIANVFCAIAETANGRLTYAERILSRIGPGDDLVICRVLEITNDVVALLRRRLKGELGSVLEKVRELSVLGYADVAKVLLAVCLKLGERISLTADNELLTPAEVGILRMLEDGFIPKEIAARTDRSVYTVRAHIANAIAKLECHGRFEAVRVARQRGLLDAASASVHRGALVTFH